MTLNAATSPKITAREILFISAAAILLAIISSWPLALHLATHTTPDLGDPIRTAWQIAWGGHALLTSPTDLFNTNAFWPRTNTLTFSDTLLGYSPFALIGSGSTAALIRYNLIYLFAWAFPVVSAYLLARELGLRPAASAIAGVAFAYVPYKAGIAGHLHVLSSGAIALTLFLLLRGYRRSSAPLIFAGWLAATWQLTLGYTLALPFMYALGLFCVILAVVWVRRGRPKIARTVIVASVLGIAVMGAVEGFQTRHYVLTAKTYADASRSTELITAYSAGLSAWLSAPENNRVWGAITAPIRAHVNSKNEAIFFPGLTILILGAIGLFARVLPRWLRITLFSVAGAYAVLALGFGLTRSGYPYKLLYDYAPGWKGFRVPGRGIVITQLAMALLAGAGFHQLLAWWAKRPRKSLNINTQMAYATSCCVFGAFIVAEGLFTHPVVEVAKPHTKLTSLPTPQLHLPTAPATDRLYQLWSTDGYPAIVNGVSTFELNDLGELRGAMRDFPEQYGVKLLQKSGIHTVILHTDLRNKYLPLDHVYYLEPRDIHRAATKSLAGLPVTRRHAGPDVIYTIKPLTNQEKAQMRARGEKVR